MVYHLHQLTQDDQLQPVLDVRGLAAGYPGERHAVDGISFTLMQGERVATIGPNGAGKSTLFKAIAGLVPLTAGEISINGRDCRSSHAFVGYVPQQSEIDWSFPATVFDAVLMGFTRQDRWFPWARREHISQTRELLAQLSLGRLAKRQIGELSGGQRRRVFIARALAQQANVLLMDEPFTGVDGESAEEIMQALELLRKERITVLLATHDMQRAARDFDRVLLLKQRVLAFGPPDEVLRTETLGLAYAGALHVFDDEGHESLYIVDEHATGT